MKTIRRSCELLALAVSVMMLTSCAVGQPAARNAAGEKIQKQIFAMDTVMLLTAYGPAAEKALDDAAAEIGTLEADLDPEDPAGSVWALNAGAGGPVNVSEDCYHIMSTYMALWRETEGALDPALYPVIQAWGFTTGDYRVPGSAELEELLAKKNTGAIALDEAAGAVTLPADMAVSFGAVAKGYAAQKAADVLTAAGVESAILSLGGNVQTVGERKTDGSPWTVAVTDPRDTGSYVGILTVNEGAVVTSGGYQRYFDANGHRYIHILDPMTGYPAENGLLSVTVVTGDGARADGLSTALFVMGEDRALDFQARTDDLELVLITDDDRVIVTAGLADRFEEHGEGYVYEYLS